MKTEIVDCGIGWMLEVRYDNGEKAQIPFVSYRNAQAAQYAIEFDYKHHNENKSCNLHCVTRCRDCQHWSPPIGDRTLGRCELLKRPSDPLFWCRGGVRNNGEA